MDSRCMALTPPLYKLIETAAVFLHIGQWICQTRVTLQHAFE